MIALWCVGLVSIVASMFYALPEGAPLILGLVVAVFALLVVAWCSACMAVYPWVVLQKHRQPVQHTVRLVNRRLLSQCAGLFLAFALVLVASLGLALIVGIGAAIVFDEAAVRSLWFSAFVAMLVAIMLIDVGFFSLLIAEEQRGAVSAIKASFSFAHDHYFWLLLCALPFVLITIPASALIDVWMAHYLPSPLADVELVLSTKYAQESLLVSVALTLLSTALFYTTMALAYGQLREPDTSTENI